MAAHGRSKNGVASLAYVPAIHVFLVEPPPRRGCPAFAGHDASHATGSESRNRQLWHFRNMP
jgi:hypothetical protein